MPVRRATGQLLRGYSTSMKSTEQVPDAHRALPWCFITSPRSGATSPETGPGYNRTQAVKRLRNYQMILPFLTDKAFRRQQHGPLRTGGVNGGRIDLAGLGGSLQITPNCGHVWTPRAQGRSSLEHRKSRP